PQAAGEREGSRRLRLDVSAYTSGMDSGAPLQFDAIPVPTPPGGPLAVELVPAPDPWDVARKLSHLPHLLFLDSAEKHAARGRYSYVSADPYGIASDFAGLRQMEQSPRRIAALPEVPPFQGGYAGLFGYGLGRHFERIPLPRYDE